MVRLRQGAQHGTMQPPIRRGYTFCAMPAAWRTSAEASGVNEKRCGVRLWSMQTSSMTRDTSCVILTR